MGEAAFPNHSRLLAAISHAVYWSLTPHETGKPRHYVAHCHTIGGQTLVEHAFTREDVRSLDKRLLVALSCMFSSMPGDSTIRGAWVRNSLRYYAGDYFLLPADACVARTPKQWLVTRFNHLEAETPAHTGQTHLKLYGTVLSIRPGVKGLMYATDTETPYIKVKTSWLDVHCPGWLQRLQIGEALGLKSESLAQHVMVGLPDTTVAAEVAQLPKNLLEG